MDTFFLVAVALLPAIVLCGYVFYKDRVEKEPIKLLLLLLFLGALSCLPAAILEGVFDGALSAILPEQADAAAWGYGVTEMPSLYLYRFLESFIVIALVEEGLKFIIMYLVTGRNKAFNSLFDGIIYAVFVSLGFAALENILYVFSNGLSVGIMRAVLSVPGHMFFGVMMGYYYSLWHVTEKVSQQEKALKSCGLINSSAEETKSGGNLFKSLLIPVLAHGFYDFCCMLGTEWAMLVLIAFVVFMYVHCFGKIRKMSKADAYETAYVNYLIKSKYPHIETDEEAIE